MAAVWKQVSRGVVVLVCHPSSQEAEAGGSQFKVSLGYKDEYLFQPKPKQKTMTIKRTSLVDS